MKSISLQWKDYCLHKIFIDLVLKSCFPLAFPELLCRAPLCSVFPLLRHLPFLPGSFSLPVAPCRSSSLTHMHTGKKSVERSSTKALQMIYVRLGASEKLTGAKRLWTRKRSAQYFKCCRCSQGHIKAGDSSEMYSCVDHFMQQNWRQQDS